MSDTDNRAAPTRRDLFIGSAALVAGAAGGLLLPGRAAAQQNETAPAPLFQDQNGAGFYRFRIGGFDALSVSDGMFPIGDAYPTFGLNASEEEFQAALDDYFLPMTNIGAHVNQLFVDTGRHRVLIDTGSGPGFGPTVGHVRNNLARAGVDTDSIDVIILTHAHPDHVFGNITPEGEVAYPNAQFHIHDTEWQFWTAESVDLSAMPLPEEVTAMLIGGAQHHLGSLPSGSVTRVSDGQEIVPGIRAMHTPGHTPGHLSLMIESDGEALMHCTDVVHSHATSFAYPTWQIAFDADREAAVETRLRFLDQAATDGVRIMGYHMPFPGLGHVRRRGDAYEWLPEPWEWRSL